MGKASTSSSNSSENFNSTTTPTNPSWVTNGLAGVGNTLSNIGNIDPYSMVPGATQQQVNAGANALNLGGIANNDMNLAGAAMTGALNVAAPTINNGGGAASMTPAAMQAASLLPGLSSGQYMSPYLNSVVNASMANYDYGAGQTQAQNKLALANDSTFGGSGGSIQTALSNDAITRGRASLASGLLDQGYTQAASLANLDAQRQQDASQTNAQMQETAGQTNAQLQEAANQRYLQGSTAAASTQQQQDQINQAAANSLANIGQATDANNRANVATQGSIGDMLRQIQQQQLTAPYTAAGSLANIWGSLPLSLLNGKTTTGTDDKSGSQTGVSAGVSWDAKNGLSFGG